MIFAPLIALFLKDIAPLGNKLKWIWSGPHLPNAKTEGCAHLLPTPKLLQHQHYLQQTSYNRIRRHHYFMNGDNFLAFGVGLDNPFQPKLFSAYNGTFLSGKEFRVQHVFLKVWVALLVWGDAQKHLRSSSFPRWTWGGERIPGWIRPKGAGSFQNCS